MVRFAVIGTNWITDRFLEAAKQVQGFQLKAVYSRTDDRAKAYASQHGAPRTFTSVQALAECEDVDAVYIASPNSFHHLQALELMKQGKHVLCEKPLASNLKEVQALISSAKENRVHLMEAMKSTCMPNFRIIQENLEKLGMIRRYVSNFCKVSSRYDAYKKGTILNAFNPVFSNGSLMDLGVYGIYPMVVLFGQPKAIKANGLMLDSGVDGEGTVVAQYEGMEGVVFHSKMTDSYFSSEIQGEEGTMIIDKISAPSHVIIRYRNGTEEEISVQQPFPPMYYEIESFIQAVNDGSIEPSINTHEESLVTASILEEARKQMGLNFPADH